VIPDNVDDEGLKEAYTDAEKHRWNKAELRAYDNFGIAVQDKKGRITAAEKKSKSEEKKEVIERCWRKKMDIEDIAEIAELSIEEVAKIIEKIKKRKEEEK